METNKVSVFMSEGLRYVEDFGIAVMSLGPIPLTILGCLIIGLVAKALCNVIPYGTHKSHKAIVPILVVMAGCFLFPSLTDPDVTAFQPNGMKNPEVRFIIIGAVCGVASIAFHRKFIKGTKLEKVLTLENGEETPPKPPTPPIPPV